MGVVAAEPVVVALYLLEREVEPRLAVWAVDFAAVLQERPETVVKATVVLETEGFGLGLVQAAVRRA